MAHNHDGDPAPGSNPYIGFDATDLVITDPSGPASSVIPVTTPFTVAAVFELSGTLADWLVSLELDYTVAYTFVGRGVPQEETVPVTGKTRTGQKTYGRGDTDCPMAAGSLQKGLYELSAVVTFGGYPPISAFINYPVIEIF